MTFESKKIESETLGEYLTSIREKLGLTMSEVEAKTSIKHMYLDALESGRLNRLPPSVYVLGFLRLLAKLYAVDSEELIAQFKKERSIQDQMNKASGYVTVRPARSFNKLVVTPKILSISVGVLFVGITLIYIIWQVFSINKTPSLEIVEPKDRQIVKDSYVTVSGKTDPGITVTINDQNVFVDEQGNFKTQLGVGQGPKDLVFTAKNKFDKAEVKKIVVVGDAPVAVQGVQDTRIVLQITATEDVVVTTQSDEEGKVKKNLSKDDQLEVSAKNKILLSTDNAAAIKVVFNGKDVGLLGKPKEALKDIPFSLESDTIK